MAKKTTTTKLKPAAATTAAVLTSDKALPKKSADLGLPNSHQSVWARAVRIHAWIIQGRRFTTADLMKEFETDERTIRRAFEFMRNQLGAPIEFDPDRQTFYYTREWNFLPSLLVTKMERFVVQLLQQMFPEEVDPTFGPAVHSIAQKVSAVAGSDPLDESLKEVGLPKALLGAAELKHVPTVHEAISGQRELRILYCKPGDTTPVEHVLRPHKLRYITKWIILAHDMTRGGERRTFILARVKAAEILPTTFTRPKNFDPDKILAGNIGAYTGDEDHLVRVALRGRAIVKAEEDEWHPSQQLVRRTDGVVELTIRLNNIVEVENDVLECGEFAEVLAPAALRAAVRKRLLAASAFYGSDPV